MEKKKNKYANKVTKQEGKKVYQRPRVVSEEAFETLALSCCKSNICRKYGFPRGLHGVS